jgi:L-asparaginase
MIAANRHIVAMHSKTRRRKALSSGYNRRMTNPPAAILLLTTCLTAVAQNLPTVVVLSTGGTIASKQDPAKGGYVLALSGEDLVSAVPAIREIAQIQVEQIANIGSPDMTPEIWVRLAGRVNELLAKPGIAGVVVTHGTDTLEETAYFLDLTTISTKPVILAQHERPPGSAGEAVEV